MDIWAEAIIYFIFWHSTVDFIGEHRILLTFLVFSNPLILLRGAQTIRIRKDLRNHHGSQLPGSRISSWQRSSLCPGAALPVASARSGVKFPTSDHCAMSLAKVLCSLIWSLKTGIEVSPWLDCHGHHMKWHLCESLMTSENIRQMLVLRPTKWPIRLQSSLDGDK